GDRRAEGPPVQSRVARGAARAPHGGGGANRAPDPPQQPDRGALGEGDDPRRGRAAAGRRAQARGPERVRVRGPGGDARAPAALLREVGRGPRGNAHDLALRTAARTQIANFRRTWST